jgi:hypothetical protein
MAAGTTLSLKRLDNRHAARQQDVICDNNDIEALRQRLLLECSTDGLIVYISYAISQWREKQVSHGCEGLLR